MFVPLTKSIVSCLDRKSALRLARLKPDAEVLKRRVELEKKKRTQSLAENELAAILLIDMSLEMLADLQLEAEACFGDRRTHRRYRRKADPSSNSML